MFQALDKQHHLRYQPLHRSLGGLHPLNKKKITAQSKIPHLVEPQPWEQLEYPQISSQRHRAAVSRAPEPANHCVCFQLQIPCHKSWCVSSGCCLFSVLQDVTLLAACSAWQHQRPSRRAVPPVGGSCPVVPGVAAGTQPGALRALPLEKTGTARSVVTGQPWTEGGIGMLFRSLG